MSLGLVLLEKLFRQTLQSDAIVSDYQVSLNEKYIKQKVQPETKPDQLSIQGFALHR